VGTAQVRLCPPYDSEYFWRVARRVGKASGRDRVRWRAHHSICCDFRGSRGWCRSGAMTPRGLANPLCVPAGMEPAAAAAIIPWRNFRRQPCHTIGDPTSAEPT
jgi:hypothetical protein